MGFFDVVKGYVRPEVLVSVEALPFRPTRGVVMQVVELAEPHAIGVERLFRWYDTLAIPAALRVAGVAGAYTFSSVTSTIDDGFVADADARTFAPATAARAGSLRITVYFCDGDPSAAKTALDASFDALRDRAPHGDPLEAAGACVIFDSAAEVIEPWKWDWFD
jgi:hypothetical protein